MLDQIGPLQLRVMQVVWRLGSCTAHAVHDQISAGGDHRPVVYSTVLSVMRNLTRRGYLAQRRAFPGHIFTAKVDERRYKTEMVRRLRQDVFNGSKTQLLVYLDADLAAAARRPAQRTGNLVAV